MSEPTIYTYSVPTVSCDHCVKSITDKVAAVPGVNDVTVDLDTKSVTVAGGTDTEITEAIAAAGYQIPGNRPRRWSNVVWAR